MASNRLEQQYLKLLNHFGETKVSVTLQELSDLLFCTKRHMRNLLIQMQESGWIDWQAEFGRGKRSALTLLSNKNQLLRKKSEILIDKGRFNEAIDLLGSDKHLVAPLLRSKLGFRINPDNQILRVPYYRTMYNLYPGTPLRRSERHLIRQIFSGLTRVKEETGEVEGDLAHHWRKINPFIWRFYIRPAVQFHDGQPLTCNDIVTSLNRTRKLALFSHIEQIKIVGPHCIEFELSAEDDNFPQLLATASALILPSNHDEVEHFSRLPVGTGPYQVVQNDERLLCLKAFDGYFGFRALLDQIDILMWPNLTHQSDVTAEETELSLSYKANSAWLSSSLSDQEYIAGVESDLTGGPSDLFEDMFLEQGGYFLLCDSHSDKWQKPESRAWLQQLLNPYSILKELSPAIRYLWVPATSLLPNWCHRIAPTNPTSPFKVKASNTVIRLAYHEHHPEFPALTNAIATLLKQNNIDLEIVTLPYEQWAQGTADNIDLWLGTINFPVPETWHVGAWLLSSPLMRRSISGRDNDLLQSWHNQWRSGEINSEHLIWQVVRSGWLQPLFHHWMRLKGPSNAQGIHLNNLGWFDFRSTWFEPEDK
ncbi:SgrR family transcriptional regulator [Vibrio rumoiensis]|uniref:Peptide ABC transporter substrate-binding protein n=1 Tax=Vibrio rumoiensis 1S-45 TaxID=1188252 RepID=A0A1E5E2C3_9VIBR|nr:SgrR family transcriptional regulator [Vibrio rumoiensis]OEF25219.1 peptide ABC transporter substrate-binding protein [Vibrio rumoiensis 1S-45]